MDPNANGELVSMPCARRGAFRAGLPPGPAQRFGGNISRTANFVGMERSALRKLKTLGLHGDD